jgi:hypothetical protein
MIANPVIPALQAVSYTGNIVLYLHGDILTRRAGSHANNIKVINGWYCPEFGARSASSNFANDASTIETTPFDCGTILTER